MEFKMERKNYNRRKFFGTLGLSAVGIALLNSLPGKIFAGEKNKRKNKAKSSLVKIHPSAVKRNK